MKLPTSPIDDSVRDGGFHLVFAGDEFAVVRFNGAAWEFGSGVPYEREPTTYYRAGASDGQG